MEKMNVVEMIGEVAQRFETADIFYGHGTASAWDEAVALVLHVANIPFDVAEASLQRELSTAEVDKINDLVEKRITQQKPLPYLINEAYFFGLPFYVDERVIIPRSPIAELIETQFNPWVDFESVHNILDLCTGSGCIAIACAFAFENAKVDAVDIDSDALAVAKINCERHQVEDQVKLIQSDLFDNLPEKKYDIIVSNPPYVSDDEMAALPKEYLHEPKLALQADDEGLLFAIRILKQAANYLNDNGILVVEVGASWFALAERYSQVPFLWLEFAYGGEGVFLLTKEQLVEFAEIF